MEEARCTAAHKQQESHFRSGSSSYIRLVSDTLVNIHFVYDRLDRAQPHAALRPRPLGGAWGRRGPNPPLRPRSGSVTQYLRSAPTPPHPTLRPLSPTAAGLLPVTLRPRPRHVEKADFPIGYVSLRAPALALPLAASAWSRPHRMPPGDASPLEPARKRMRRAPSLSPVDSRPHLPSRHGGRC